MPYKISGTKSETARIIILKESNWSIESETVISGSGAYEIDELESGDKLTFSRAEDGEIVGFGAVAAVEYTPPSRGVFAGGFLAAPGSFVNTIDYITISSVGNATDFGDLTLIVGGLTGCSNSTNNRGIFGGGGVFEVGVGWTYHNTVDYITISTPADAIDFGDLTVARLSLAGTSNGTSDRGIFAGGANDSGNTNTIEYITISTPSNSTYFGDLIIAKSQFASTSNGTNDRGVFASQNLIEYITISSTGNTTNFGDLTVERYALSATSNGTNNRGVFGGSYINTNIIDYITISTLADAIDFGDLTVARGTLGATSNGTNDRGVFAGGYAAKNTIDYITISTPADAIDFGDLTIGRRGSAATSNA